MLHDWRNNQHELNLQQHRKHAEHVRVEEINRERPCRGLRQHHHQAAIASNLNARNSQSRVSFRIRHDP
ncbi:MAG TPA: hypothetical protein VJL61_15995 [Rhodanobacteraceae bacterium]|nr:hypothetical protein [Rhodanobacteraceae bacterium]